MSNPLRRIELGENHRRAVSVLMRGTEQACKEVEEWLERTSGALTEVREDVPPEQEARLRELTARLRAEVQEFSGKVTLDKRRMSRRRSIAAIVCAALIDLEEVQDSGLKGYGKMSEEAKEVLNEYVVRMLDLLEQMLHIAEAQ
ncbi:MAG TPA: hypothetical protein VLY23_08005 [Candidatus Acidoferrum sp.]|nr:hypothetical protein [Candidatus Acidoferrum sp.]